MKRRGRGGPAGRPLHSGFARYRATADQRSDEQDKPATGSTGLGNVTQTLIRLEASLIFGAAAFGLVGWFLRYRA